MNDAATADMTADERLTSKVMGIAGVGLSYLSLIGMGKTAGAFMFGYATLGVAAPMVGYGVLLAASVTMVKHHFGKLGWDKAPVAVTPGGEGAPNLPTASDLQKALTDSQASVEALNEKADQLGVQLNLSGRPSQP